MKPLLSICIPTYNRSVYLKECLESILFSANGLEDRIEIVISDNASEDDTAAVISKIQAQYPCIKYERNPENIGCQRNVYKVVTMASSDYVWLIGDDDKIAAEAIPTALRHIESGYDLIIPNYSVYNKDFSGIRVQRAFTLGDNIVFDDPNEVMMNFGAQLGYLSILIIRKSLFLASPFSEYESFVEWGFSIMYAAYYGLTPKSRILYLHEPLLYNRSDNSGGYDWHKCVAVGTTLVLTTLRDRGYSPSAVLSARQKVLKDWIIHDILVRKRDGQSTKGFFRMLYPYYKKLWVFWLGCVPALLMPRFVVQLIDNIILKPRRLRRHLILNSHHKNSATSEIL